MPQVTDSGSGIQNDALAAARDFDAARVAAEGDMIGRRTGDAAPDTPELDLE
jgi:hypothetical protein